MTSRLARGALAAASAAALIVGLAACAPAADQPAASSSPAGSADASGDLGTVRVGALPTPAGDLLKWVNDNLAAEAGLVIEYVEFTDYNTPNPALSDGSVDANLFQNSTFMETYNSQSGGDLVSVGEIYLPAAAYYSEKVTSLDELADGAKVAIPNDPTNEGRALGLLAAEGVIEINDGATTLNDITANPKNIQFIEIENASLALALPDNDAVFVTASFALPAGLTSDSAILTEGTDSEYYNILATTPELESDPRIVKLVELLTDDRTKEYLETTWQGLIVPVA